MRATPNIRVEVYRKVHPKLGASEPGENWGYFVVDGMNVISSGSNDGDPNAGHFDAGVGWEHVSCSFPNRCPTWEEMCKVKELFWNDEETVVQFHPKKSAAVNTHNYCLHLWKKTNGMFELPPRELVG